jgi:hypothetical protein
MMMILMTAALAAAAPAESVAPNAAPHSQHMPMGHHGSHAQMKCCECCKDMAKEDEGHGRHEGHETR